MPAARRGGNVFAVQVFQLIDVGIALCFRQQFQTEKFGMYALLLRLGILPLLLLVAGCAASVTYSYADLAPERSGRHPPQALQQAVRIKFDTGYSRHLSKGSQWIRIGSLRQGQVYKSYRDIFTVEGSNVHEACLVVSDHHLVGFYLPVEHGFSPLRQPLPITFNEQEQ